MNNLQRISNIGFSATCWVLLFLCSCTSFKEKILNDKRFSSGKVFGTNEKIPLRFFEFGKYFFVAGNDTNGKSSLGLFFNSNEIYFEQRVDGDYDTVLVARLNKDSIPDFLVFYAFEDGVTLSALLSKSNRSFRAVTLRKDISDYYCAEQNDTAAHLLPPIVKDINSDGKDEILLFLCKMNGKIIATSCTDTVIINE
jgi:hypothetical protein